MAKHNDRHRRDQAGVGPDPALTSRLVSIDELDGFRIAAGEPDIRGWDVCTISGREIGEVDDLLVDARRGEVVMLDVDINDSDRHAEIPIRAVQLDRANRRVLVDSADVDGYEISGRRALLSDADRDQLRDEYQDVRNRDVRYNARAVDAADNTVQETVLEQRPVVMEEVVIRRRVVNQPEPDEKS